MNVLSVLASRAWISLTTLPTDQAAWNVVAVTSVTTFGAGAVAIGTGFVEPVQDFNPPSIASLQAEPASMLPLLKPLSAFIFPSLLEELFWRGMILSPPPTSHLTSLPAPWLVEAGIALVVHVATHPLAGRTVWPRGRKTFEDYRFLGLASIVWPERRYRTLSVEGVFGQLLSLMVYQWLCGETFLVGKPSFCKIVPNQTSIEKFGKCVPALD
ncbi:hypothetical protein IV203_013525 [Nitzschia inconspicua]|uniref:Uncharacterized protein n=1 Tax=Nitzschia inconspicua TaxID=303405 RepID=A0A9K3M705_9STRA|nr:hypothetical protein IV203_013525 [Nitzschia inconspicua]